MKKIIIVLFSLSLLQHRLLYSQQSISFKIAPFAAHLGSDANMTNYLSKITKDGILTLEPSFQIAYEYYGKQNTSLKFIQGIGKDQMKKFYGFSQFLLRYTFILSKKNTFILGIGPNFQFRNTWTNFSNYISEGIYKETGGTQYNTFWLSGEIEFNHYINKNFDFSASINHIHPYSLGIFVGIKYWLTRKSTYCTTCPSYH